MPGADVEHYTLTVTKQDRRCRSGLRQVGVYHYGPVDARWMREEVQDLIWTLYRPKDGYHLTFEPDPSKISSTPTA